jgi:cardiolipin synthase
VTIFFEDISFVATLILIAYWLVIAVVLINDGRDPATTLSWLLFLVLLPVFGLVFYFFFGRNWAKKTMKSQWFRDVKEAWAPVNERLHEEYASAAVETREWAKENDYDRIVETIANADGNDPLPAYDVTIMPSGGEMFAHLKEELAQAQDSIHIQFFIWERDQLTQDLIDILIDRVKAGVEVRMLNDFLGCLTYRKDQLKKLQDAGGVVSYDVSGLGKVNYRNHRKIVVIDGVIGYTGGINVGQEYIDGGDSYPSWRDTHVRFQGPLVADLQNLFAMRWLEVEKQDLYTERYFPAEYPTGERRTLGQVVSTGVESPTAAARRAHCVGISSAKERVWLQSPYYIPTDDVLTAMMNAALSGLDVRFMMTGWPDKKIAWNAANTYLLPFLLAGGKVYHYDAGFFHAKTMMIDGEIAVIGTMNLDVRSLALHKELMAWFYDRDIAQRQEAIFLADMEKCHEITVDSLVSRGPVREFRDHFARLASNLL